MRGGVDVVHNDCVCTAVRTNKKAPTDKTVMMRTNCVKTVLNTQSSLVQKK